MQYKLLYQRESKSKIFIINLKPITLRTRQETFQSATVLTKDIQCAVCLRHTDRDISYFSGNKNFLLFAKRDIWLYLWQLNPIHTQRFSYIDFNIILLNVSISVSFYASEEKYLLPHCISVKLSSLVFPCCCYVVLTA